MATFQQRSQYQPDGGMRWSGLPLLVVVPLLVAVAGGYVLNSLYMNGWYLVVVVPLVVGGLLILTQLLMVSWTHCRKPWMVALTGLLAGSVCYLSCFHFGLMQAMPPGNAHRVDLLPHYIKFRMDTDAAVDAGKPNDQPVEPEPFMNWFTFIYEFAIIAGLTAEAGRRRALAGYDAKHECWMKNEKLAFQVGVRDELVRALETDQVEQFCQTHRPLGINPQSSVCIVQLDYTHAENVSPLERPIYLSANESQLRAWIATFFRRSKILDQSEITREEALSFQPFFTLFDQLLRERHEELRDLPSEVAGVNAESVRWTTSHATIQPISEQDQCGIFSGWNLLASNICGGAMLVGFAGGPALCYLAYHFHATIGLGPALVIGVIGGLVCLASIHVAMCCPQAPEMAYGRSRMKRCIDARAGALVKPDDPGAAFIALTERQRWAKVKLETMTDAGFASVDSAKQTLRLECDAERMEIPASSIVQCGTESFQHPLDQQTEHWMVRLVVLVPEGQREILVADGKVNWGRNTNHTRRERAQSLAAQIIAMDVSGQESSQRPSTST